MPPPPRLLSTAFLGFYRLWARFQRKTFSALISGAFAQFGANSVLAPPIRIEGEQRMAIGSGVFVGPGSWLHVEGDATGVALEIGDGSSIGAYSTVSAVSSVRIGRRVLTARHIYISDHSHEFSDPEVAVRDQGVDRIMPVEIGDGAWLGEGVIVCPGVRIGRGAVIGANSVVLADVPDYGVAVGSPARVTRVRSRDESPEAASA